MTDLQATKRAAEPILRELVEQAGFRPSRLKNKFHCIYHEDTDPSCHLYESALHLFCCDVSLDAINLAALIANGATADGIRWLEFRLGLEHSLPTHPFSDPRLTSEQIAIAQQFRYGLRCRTEDQLAAAKTAFWEGNQDNGSIQALTELANEVEAWNSKEAFEAYRSLARTDRRLAGELVSEAEALQDLIAGFIITLGRMAQKVAA